MYPRIIETAPATEPITTADAKSHLRVTISDDNDYIDGLVKAAREYVESITNRALITQTWKVFLPYFPAGDAICLPLPPLISITHLKYTDSDGDTSTVDASTYHTEVNGDQQGRLVRAYGESWPSATLKTSNPVEVQFDAGYGDADAVPTPIIQAMKLLIWHWYENRSALNERRIASKPLAFAVDALLAQFHVETLE